MLFWWQWIIIGVFLDSNALSDLLLKKMTQALWKNISKKSIFVYKRLDLSILPTKTGENGSCWRHTYYWHKKGKQLKHDWEDIQTTYNELLRSEKGGWGWRGSITKIFSPIELNDLWSKKICRPKMTAWSYATFILRWSCFFIWHENGGHQKDFIYQKSANYIGVSVRRPRFLCFYIIKSIARKGYFGPQCP